MRVKPLVNKWNKGFTLVELIIVIAIIATLSAVALPQYFKYVEKARIGVDESYIGEVAHTLEVIAVTDVRVHSAPVTVTFDTAGKIQGSTASGANADVTERAVDTALADVFPVEAQRFVSHYYMGTGDEVSSGVVLALDAGGVVTISGTKNLND